MDHGLGDDESCARANGLRLQSWAGDNRSWASDDRSLTGNDKSSVRDDGTRAGECRSRRATTSRGRATASCVQDTMGRAQVTSHDGSQVRCIRLRLYTPICLHYSFLSIHCESWFDTLALYKLPNTH